MTGISAIVLIIPLIIVLAVYLVCDDWESFFEIIVSLSDACWSSHPQLISD